MRKNVKEIAAAWANGRAKGRAGDSISTDGANVYSYVTCILTMSEDGRAILNATNYSRTTNAQQHALRQLLTMPYIEVVDVRWNASPADVRTASTKRVRAFEIVNHGVDHSQYFQGCGTSYTDFTDVATGAADNAKEAYEQAIDQLVMNGWDANGFPKNPRGISKRDKVPAEARKSEESELYYYVSVRVR